MSRMKRCKGCGAEVPKDTVVCPYCGRKFRKKHPFLIFLLIVVLIIFISSIYSKIRDDNKKKTTYIWPSSGVATVIPEPSLKYGKIIDETEDEFSIYLNFASQNDYNKYVDACRNNGFSVDYQNSGDYFTAKDKDGNELSITYSEKEETVEVYLKSSKLVTEEEAEEEKKKNEDSADASSSDVADEDSDSNDSEDSKVENVDFREWVDSYEKFMNEYCDFMEKYDENDPTQVVEYGKLFAKYTDFMTKTASLNEDDYSADDWAYYMAAYGRIMDRLSKIDTDTNK